MVIMGNGDKKPIYVEPMLHRKLSKIKAHFGLRTLEDAISYILKKADGEIAKI